LHRMNNKPRLLALTLCAFLVTAFSAPALAQENLAKFIEYYNGIEVRLQGKSAECGIKDPSRYEATLDTGGIMSPAMPYFNNLRDTTIPFGDGPFIRNVDSLIYACGTPRNRLASMFVSCPAPMGSWNCTTMANHQSSSWISSCRIWTA
jgi:hypothetical protein